MKVPWEMQILLYLVAICSDTAEASSSPVAARGLEEPERRKPRVSTYR